MARKTREESCETRKKLLDSALEVMCEKPFSNVSMNEIAERVGLSKGAVYWHFRNKGAIVVELVREICCAISNEPVIKSDGADSLNVIRSFYKDRIHKRTSCSDWLGKLTILFQRKLEWPVEVHKEVHEFLTECITKEIKAVEAILREGQKKGVVRSDISAKDISTVIAATFFGFFVVIGTSPLYMMEEVNMLKYTDFVFNAFEKEILAQYQ